MNQGDIVIFGAGCIGRGLLGERAAAAGRRIVFVEAVDALAAALRQADGFNVRLVGREQSVTRVIDYQVISTRDHTAIAGALHTCAFAATAVGGAHLPAVAALMTPGVRQRDSALNILVCENWPNADQALTEQLIQNQAPAERFACIPCSVERMVRAQPDTLDLCGESLESLYFDVTRCRGAAPELPGLRPCNDLTPYYARKLFTNNAGHAVLAYEGHLAGHRLLCDAHRDPDIRAYVEALLAGAAEMLHRTYGLTREALREHVDILLRYRYANETLADTVRRVARNPLRKLGPSERLTGLLRRLEKAGLDSDPVCRTMAAAMAYFDAEDDECLRLRAMLAEQGPASVLRDVCEVDPDEPAGRACLRHWKDMFNNNRQEVTNRR